jgi:sugar phosphate isomerase/epimerase
VIFGASSFAGPLRDLKGHVRFIELYIPKMDVYNGAGLEMEKLETILDKISIYNFECTVHAPFSAEDPKYPLALSVDTSRMGEREFAIMEESISLANRIGAGIVVLHPGRVGPDREKAYSSMVSNLQTLASIAEDYGVTLGLENKEGTDPSNFCCEAEELARTIETVNSVHLKATFDIGHANLTCGGNSEKLRAFVKTLRKHIIHLHLHDNNGQWSEKFDGDEHLAPGKGCTDFSVLKLLSGYRGIYNLEVYSVEDICSGIETVEKSLNDNLSLKKISGRG